jgi:GTP-binding protein
VTRDLVSADLPGGVTLLDTGGLGLVGGETPTELLDAVERQVELAIAMADVLLFVLDGREGLLPQDREIAAMLRRTGKRVIPAVNKIDGDGMEDAICECAALGFSESPAAVSAEHGRGIEELESRLYGDLPPADSPPERPLTFALLGAPNVGKSSIANALLGMERMIVSPIAGTTRDTVHGDFSFSSGGEEHAMRILDTAGLRSGKKISSPVEYFSSLRARRALEDADAVFLVLDAVRGLTSFDKAIAEEVREAGKCLAVAVNKWDVALDAIRRDALPAYGDGKSFQRDFAAALRRELFAWPDLPLLFFSAATGNGIGEICTTAIDLRRRTSQQIGTGQLNRFLGEHCDDALPSRGGKSFKLFYALQTASAPVSIRIYCNDRSRLDGPQLARLRRHIVEHFSLGGCSLRLEFHSKERRRK